MDGFYLILGLAMIYSWGHFFIFSFKKTYEKRTDYERVVTWFAIVSFVLFVFGSLSS